MQGHAAGETGEDAVAERESTGGHFINPRRVDAADGLDFFGFAAGEQAREIDAVAADVHEGAAGEGGVESYVAGDFAGGEAEAGADQAQFADRAAFDGLEDGQRLRVRAVHEGFDEDSLILARGIEHFLGFLGVDADGLLAEDVFAGFERGDGPMVVEIVGEGVVNGVHVFGGDELMVAAICGADAEIGGEFHGRRFGARADGGKLAAAAGADAFGELAGDVSGAEDGPAEFGRHFAQSILQIEWNAKVQTRALNQEDLARRRRDAEVRSNFSVVSASPREIILYLIRLALT